MITRDSTQLTIHMESVCRGPLLLLYKEKRQRVVTRVCVVLLQQQNLLACFSPCLLCSHR
jgi:hypothetical protein